MHEQWKDIYFEEDGVIYDYRGMYQVSNLGNVKSLNYNHTGKEKILKPIKHKDDYSRVNLYKNNKTKMFRVHRLVLHMFDSNNYFDGAEVDHINTVRFDNRLENLCWVTSKQNSNNPLTKQKYSQTKSITIAQYDKETHELIKIWNSSMDIKRELGISQSSIIFCCKFWEMNCNKEEYQKKYKNRPRKTAGGYVFKYAEPIE